MALPKPSLTLLLDIDEELESTQLRQEVARCWTHICTTLVRTHTADAEDAKLGNIARMLVKFGGHKYLYSSDSGSDDLWHGSVEHWVYNELYNIGNNIQIFNRRQREIGNPELAFEWMELELQNDDLSVLLHLNSVCGIEPGTNEVVTAMRKALNAKQLAENPADVKRIIAPSFASYATQLAVSDKIKEQREAEEAAAREAEEAAAREAAARAEAKAEEQFLESPELLAAQDGDELAIEAAIQAELEEKYALPAPDFDIDYTQWQIVYQDGSSKLFDSATGKLMEAAQ